jgi:hypothetical protein
VSSQPDMPRPDGGTNTRSSTSLRGRWLIVARAAWIMVAILSVGLCVAGAWTVFAAYPNMCVGSARQAPYPPCFEYWMTQPLLDLRFRLPTSLQYGYQLALQVVRVLVFWVVAALIFWKKSDDWMALLVSLALVTLGAPEKFLWVVGSLDPTWNLPGSLVSFLGRTSLFLSFFLFPNGRFVPRWTRWIAAVWVLGFTCGFVSELFSVGELFYRSMPAILSAVLSWSQPSFLAIATVAQIYRYRLVSGPIQRQQVRLVVGAATVWVVWLLASMLFDYGLYQYRLVDGFIEDPWI